ncbi:MAG: chromosomal replication initiator protein DnaA [Spirochaetota bacterium]|nr:chromosomal replication initiator protein DnaA [Spirochaetota bacterium]
MLDQEWHIIELFLKKEYPEDQELWLNHIKLLSTTKNEIFISVPNQVYKDRVVDKYLNNINRFIESRFSKKIDLKIMVDENEDDDIITLPSKTHESTGKTNLLKSLNPKNTFEQFVVGNNNQLAHAAAVRISEYPGQDYNPFFLYGGVGLGKTHLMQAIGHEIHQNDPVMEVIYITSEQFTNEYVSSIIKKQPHAFRLKYRHSDVLLIDDIQFLEGKEGIQEELFHTFNMLKESGKQMVFTSDRPPRELKAIMDRLISRFASGLVADIKAPDLETRQAIIRKKMIKNNIRFDDEIVLYLASNITHNVRDLEAAVIKLKSIINLLKEKLTLKRVEQELHEILNYHVGRKNISIERIQKEVANYYNISYSDMKSKKRSDAIAKPRHIAVYLAKQLTNLSTTELGNEFGGRNHSTIISAYQKIEAEIIKNESTRNDIEHLKSRLLRA